MNVRPASTAASGTSAGAGSPTSDGGCAGQPRRGFFARLAAIVIGSIVGLVPLVSGLVVFLSPLWKRGQHGTFVRVADLAQVPDDGTPRQFTVVADRFDAWSRFPKEPVGAVYLRRAGGEGQVEALSVVCPHLGCFLDYDPSAKDFKCPCHKSSFAQDGTRIEGPAPRGMYVLAVDEKRLKEGQVWVNFEIT